MAYWKQISDCSSVVCASDLLIGGEALAPLLASRLLPLWGELWNMYGPTETTVWSTLTRVDRVDGAIPVGRPIANTGIYILDAHCRALPDGAIGELWVAGHGVADGYQNRPAVTPERFMREPVAAGGALMSSTAKSKKGG